MINTLRIFAIYIVCAFAIVTLVTACANVSAPSGGVKDTKKPILLTTTPRPNQLNYVGKRIILTFNEKMDISKLKEKIIINPQINVEYEIETNNKSIIVEFKKTIGTTEDTKNKTISVNFNNGLKDAAEGNTIENYKLVFSTGDRIDSGIVKGLLLDSYNQDSVNTATVGLFKYSDTMRIENNKPSYYTYSNNGIYSLDNIKKGTYKLYAFLDKNKNSLIDSKTEKIAFLVDTLEIKDTNSLYKEIYLSKNDLLKTKILSIKNETEIRVILDEGIYQYKLNNKNLFHELSPNRKEIIIYKTELCEDSVPINISVSDSSFNDTTYSLKIVQSPPKKFLKYKNLIKSLEPNDQSLFADSIHIKITFFDPIIKEKNNSVFIIIDSISNQYVSLLKDFKANSSNTIFEYHFLPKYKPRKFIQIYISGNKFQNLLGDTNMTYMNTYKPKNMKDIDEDGNVNVNIKTKYQNFIVELIKEKNEIIDRKFNMKNIKYINLIPAKYSLRLIEDNNKNNKWDSGNYKFNRQPENVTIYRNIIDVKKNWEIEDLSIEF